MYLHNYSSTLATTSISYSITIGVRRRLMTPLQKGILVIDGDRTAGTRDRGIGAV